MLAEHEIPSPYIARQEEQMIRDEVDRVRTTNSSRAVLLYGEGGIGKTRMVRKLAETRAADEHAIWLQPIDMDDPAYWLMSNLELQVITGLDPKYRYFKTYDNDLLRLAGQTLGRIDQETVVSQLDDVKQVFIDCYSRFARDSGKVIVMVLDTIEVIRGVSLLYTLTEWMKWLPSTLFILSGRPLQSDQTEIDDIRRELEEGEQGVHVRPIALREFSWQDAHDFLDRSLPDTDLTENEKTKLILLTQGHPLWLALTVGYLRKSGMPKEAADRDVADLRRQMPYGGPLSSTGRPWHQLYKEQLVSQYRDSDLQDEAIRLLAVVRQSISQDIWERLMADLAPQSVSSLSQEWENLRSIPWIRARSSRPFVTLHDAVAEEVGRTLIQTHDADGEWRHARWAKAAALYDELSNQRDQELERQQAELNGRLPKLRNELRMALEGRSDSTMPEGKGESFIDDIRGLDKRRRELDEFRTISLHYELLSDFERGADRFLKLFARARQQRDSLLQESLAQEIQRFLPNVKHQHPLEDVVASGVTPFRTWLQSDVGADCHEQIVHDVAQYQIESELPYAANEILGDLPEQASSPERGFYLNILKGNALMRMPEHSADPQTYFNRALDQANALTSDDATLLRARAHKEMGFYRRQLGQWHAADNSYNEAFDLMSAVCDGNSSDEYRAEMASILRNWAFVNGIAGKFELATNRIETAIDLYHELGMEDEEAQAHSVHGEIYRYGWQFTLAWRAYEEAERIFRAQRNRAWLGMVFQEQAICLIQADLKRIPLLPGPDPREEAKRLIRRALDICRKQNLRAYPAALNRASRVFAADDIDVALNYAEQGIDWGQRLSDEWKTTACLVEFADLCYEGWTGTEYKRYDERYRDKLRACQSQLDAATAKTEFLDLRGKWKILQGHLMVEDWLAGRDDGQLADALENYTSGFRLVAGTFVGSSSGFTIGTEFRRFRKLFQQLPPEIRSAWISEFRRAWTAPETASPVMLTRLQLLY